MKYKYGIDFGTTNSSIAIRFLADDEEEHTLVVDVNDTLPRETLPSVVLIDEDEKIYAGAEALNKYTNDGLNSTDRFLIKYIKLALENEGSSLSYNVKGKNYQGVDLIATILRELRLKAEKLVEDLEIDMSGVVMGVPVQYGDIQKNVLKEALVKAGFYESCEEANKNTEFVSEPVAVAIHYGLNLEKDETVMVFDFGGGTLDLAIINLKKQISVGNLHPHETLAKKRITLGGEDLTRLFFINSFCNPQKYGLTNIASKFGFDPELNAEEVWKQLFLCEDGIRFINAIERCKCELSRSQQFKFSFIGKNIQIEEKTFFREDFREAINKKIEEIQDVIFSCLEQGDIIDPYEIDRVILAGGSSLIPAVQDVLTNIFGLSRIGFKGMEQDLFIKTLRRNRESESEVLTSIVRGLAIVGCKENDLIDDIVDSDYGVWDKKENAFVTIIENGIKIRETVFNESTMEGLSEDFKSMDESGDCAVKIQIYQQNLNGLQELGEILIENPGGKQYRIYMHIDKNNNMLVVDLYDIVKKRWITEIPLDERQYTLE